MAGWQLPNEVPEGTPDSTIWPDGVSLQVSPNSPFSFSVLYFGPDETETLEIQYSVDITATSNVTSINIGGGTVSGKYPSQFSESIDYVDFDGNLIQLSNSGAIGAWDQYDINDCDQIVAFHPDPYLYRQYEYTAKAYDYNNDLADTLVFRIGVSARNWTPGKEAFQNALALINSRGN